MQLVFYIGVYKDQALAQRCITRLREFYPVATIVSIADGIDDPSYAQFCKDNQVQYRVGDRLKLVQFGGMWTLRFLQALLSTEADVYFKIDPDTGIHAPFDLTYLPDGDIFGNLRPLTPVRSTQGTSARDWLKNDEDSRLSRSNRRCELSGDVCLAGGCIGFNRAAAKQIIDSGLLLGHEYRTHRYIYQPFWANNLKPGKARSQELISSQDMILWDVVQRLDLSFAEFEQVCIHFRDCPSNASQQFAMTHPHAWQ